MFFRIRPRDRFWRVPVPIFFGKLDLGAVLDFRDFQKGPFKHNFRPKRIQRRGSSRYSERPCRDPAFHETRVITVPLGPTGFQKVVSWIEVGPFCFFLFFCVLLLPNLFIIIWGNTTVNVKPLNPLIFEDRPIFENKYFHHFICLRLRLRLFIYLVLLIFGYPLHPSPGPECPMFDNLGCHLW